MKGKYILLSKKTSWCPHYYNIWNYPAWYDIFGYKKYIIGGATFEQLYDNLLRKLNENELKDQKTQKLAEFKSLEELIEFIKKQANRERQLSQKS